MLQFIHADDSRNGLAPALDNETLPSIAYTVEDVSEMNGVVLRLEGTFYLYDASLRRNTTADNETDRKQGNPFLSQSVVVLFGSHIGDTNEQTTQQSQ
jgi:hypothetical protein